MKYEDYRYIFPPRPENAAPPSDINRYDNGLMFGQAKSNGSNCTIYTNGDVVYAMNRHGQPLTTFRLTKEEVIDSLYKCEKGKWLVINGEYMNKSKKDHKGNLFNHKLVVFDILVFNSEYLVGETHDSRIKILEKLYGTEDSDIPFYYKISDNIYLDKSYYGDFSKLYFDFIKSDMIEGLVIKRKGAKLEPGVTEKNNSKSMIKFRKATLNYQY